MVNSKPRRQVELSAKVSGEWILPEQAHVLRTAPPSAIDVILVEDVDPNPLREVVSALGLPESQISPWYHKVSGEQRGWMFHQRRFVVFEL